MVNRIVIVVYEKAESMRQPCGSRAIHGHASYIQRRLHSPGNLPGFQQDSNHQLFGVIFDWQKAQTDWSYENPPYGGFCA